MRKLAAFALVVSCSATAHATYSIVASDPEARVLGVAGTSCVDGTDVSLIYRSVPGVAVLVAQALYDGALQREAVELLSGGSEPSAVIAALTSAEFDADAAERQYAIAGVSGVIAAFTGSATGPVSGDLQGQVASARFSVQGNLLTSRALDGAASGFAAAACDLPERLMLALEGGARDGEGDKRCVASGIPSDSAFLDVVSAVDGASLASLRVPSSGDADPLRLLRVQFDAWRLAHPCTPPAPPAPPAASERRRDSGCAFATPAPAGGASSIAAILSLCALHCVRRATRRPRDRPRAQHSGALPGVVRRAFVRARRAERQ